MVETFFGYRAFLPYESIPTEILFGAGDILHSRRGCVCHKGGIAGRSSACLSGNFYFSGHRNSFCSGAMDAETLRSVLQGARYDEGRGCGVFDPGADAGAVPRGLE